MPKNISLHRPPAGTQRLAVVGVCVMLGACAVSHPDRQRVTVVKPGPVTVKGNADPNKALPVLVCDTGKSVCDVSVSRTPSVPVLNPQLDTFECDVSVVELIVARPNAKSLRWKLPDNRPDANALFRFRQASAVNPIGGVTPYASEALKVFKPTWVSETQFDFVRVESSLTRQAEGFAYAIYLEWTLPGQNQWRTCTPLDPVIVTMP